MSAEDPDPRSAKGLSQVTGRLRGQATFFSLNIQRRADKHRLFFAESMRAEDSKKSSLSPLVHVTVYEIYYLFVILYIEDLNDVIVAGTIDP